LDEEENSTNSEDEEDLIGSSEDLDESDELTITDINDLENEGDENMYTTSLCRQTLAKVSCQLHPLPRYLIHSDIPFLL
jgi:hypothetical protein